MVIHDDNAETRGEVLLVSRDRGTLIVLGALLERLGRRVRVAHDARGARPLLDDRLAWVVMDPALPAEQRVELIGQARQRRLQAEFIVMGDIEGTLSVMGLGVGA